MNAYRTFAATAALTLGVAACQSDFLTAGETSRNPNVAGSATENNFFVGTQLALWNTLGGDMSRVTSLWAQHITGANQQYLNYYNYGLSEQTTNGFHQGLYIQGGLVDIRNLEAAARASFDSLYLGIAQVQEAWTMGQGADMFGDLVYSHALTGESNPPLDKQMVVYAHVEALLDTAIVNMSKTGGTNVGPGSVDLSSFGGNATKWIRLAHTLKARFYMHQISAPGVLQDTLSARALAETQLGLQAGDDYRAMFSGNAEEFNYWYGFNVFAGRSGYYVASQTLIDTLTARGDTALVNRYFNADRTNLSDSLLKPNAPLTLASHVENLLLGAEAAYRTGDAGAARSQLVAARQAMGVVNPTNVPSSGLSLLHAILLEKWISDFLLGTEAWTDYRRTCTPNLAPTVPGGKVPGRLYYDTNERQTNSNIPNAGVGINGAYNQAQPPLATSDGSGQACLAQ